MKTILIKPFIIQLILIGTLNMLFFLSVSNAATFKVLFIGNSYTYVNDLPSLINELAKSTGDEIAYSSSTPGGQTFQGHFNDATTRSLINQGGWDYVVLQEQSQRPSFSDYQVAWQVYPYAKKLDSLVKVSNPCAKTVFYMTWGRKYGDQDICPYIPTNCTYQGMDDQLQLRYTTMADNNDALLCPVAKVWRSLINNYPALNLYDGDNSHPSLAGSYAAACAFYSIFFKKDPALCSYTTSLNSTDAAIIRNVSKAVVYDHMENWYAYYPNVKAGYTASLVSNEVFFLNTSENAENYEWNFGDGTSSVLENPSHEFVANGSYTVRLVVTKCSDTDTILSTVNIGTTEVTSSFVRNKIDIYPNPAEEMLYVELQGEQAEISILNFTGQILKNITVNNETIVRIEIKDLETGIYFLTIQTASASKSGKFYKK